MPAAPDAMDFAGNTNIFIGHFGLKQEVERLALNVQSAGRVAGSREWCMAQSNRGKQLLTVGQCLKLRRSSKRS